MTAHKPTLLLIDDEERILRSLAMLFRDAYRLHVTTDPHKALQLVTSERVHAIVSDQRMPLMRGAELLRQVKDRSPNTMRLLLTGYSELDAVVASVNEGEIFRFINKPWDASELRDTVRQAADVSISLFAAEPVMPLPAQLGAGSITLPPLSPSSSDAVLVVDDDAEVMKAVQEIVGPGQPVHWAQSLDEAMALLERLPVGVIVSELSVRGESVTGFLKLLKAQHPEVVAVVLTPFQDVGVFVGLINQGQVYRLLPKPVRRGPLGMSIASALRHHRMLKSVPKRLAAHVVQKPPHPEEELSGSVASRVLGFLSRMRGRNAGSGAIVG